MATYPDSVPGTTSGDQTTLADAIAVPVNPYLYQNVEDGGFVRVSVTSGAGVGSAGATVTAITLDDAVIEGGLLEGAELPELLELPESAPLPESLLADVLADPVPASPPPPPPQAWRNRSAASKRHSRAGAASPNERQARWLRCMRFPRNYCSWLGPATIIATGSISRRVRRSRCAAMKRPGYNPAMYTPQAGIFALGTSSHAYLEFQLLDAKKRSEFVSTIAAIHEPRTTTGGVNFVIGFRPELWRDIAPQETPAGVVGFNQDIKGVEEFAMPATQRDAVVWLSGSAYDVVFDMARQVIRDLKGVAALATETSSWSYRHDRDLTGFIDGSENPTLLDAPGIALLPEGVPGAAGSVLLLQKWRHRTAEWEALPVEKQERVMGRTKADSVELDDKPADSHVARTDQDEFGDIFRRNMPYGNVGDHGTMFVGFCSAQAPLSKMLDSMAGLVNGQRDALTRFSQPMTGAYYFVPSVESLQRLRG